MTAIVIVVVPMREPALRSANPIPALRERDECNPPRKSTGNGGESEPPFWTWFIENPREDRRVAI
jgi:hypothetical protein